MDEKIKEEYYNVKTGFWDAKKIYQKLKERGEKVTLKDVKRVLGKQELTQIFKPIPRYKQQYRTIHAPKVRFQYQVDLLDLTKYQKFIRGYKWLMNCVDVYSRYAMSVPMKTKEIKSVMPAFEEIIKKMGVPQNLNTGLEPAMMAKTFSNYLKQKNITHYANDPELKRNNSIVERFNRTIREVLQKYFYSRDTKNYIDILDDIVENYNSTVHTTIKNTPISVWEGKKTNNQVIKFPPPSKFKIGDVVRILKYQDNFTKKSDAKKYTKNLYTIIDIVGNTYIMKTDKGVRQRRKAFEIQRVDPETVENVKINPKGEGEKFKEEVKKQRAERRLRKEDIGTELTEKATKPKNKKRVSKPIKRNEEKVKKQKAKPRLRKEEEPNPIEEEEPNPVEEEEEEEYIVEKIVGEEIRKGKILYEIKWKVYGLDETTFESRSNLMRDLGKDFFRKIEQEWKKETKQS